MPELYAGAAQLDVTPLIGTLMPTFFNPKTSIGIHDPLYSKALVMRAGDAAMAMVCLDLLCIPAQDVAAAREIVQQRCGIPPEQVLISATHTHSAAGPANAFAIEMEPPEYHDWLRRRIADSVTMAFRRLQPAKLGYSQGQLPQHVRNRRYFMKDGTVVMNPRRQDPNIVKAAGPTDPAVTALAVLNAKDNPIAFVGNYALHYVGGTVPGEFSADYYGAVGRHLNRIRGAEFPVLWTNACSGDVNNIDCFGPPQKRAPYEQIALVAGDAAEEASRIWNGMDFTDDVHISSLVDRFDVPLRRPTEARLAEAKERYARQEATNSREWVLAREMILASQMPSPEATEVQAFRINDMAVAALPGEIFCQLGLDLKSRSPFDPTMVVSLANGYLGYIPTPEGFDQGGYETWLARSSRCAPEVGPVLVDRAAALLRKLMSAT